MLKTASTTHLQVMQLFKKLLGCCKIHIIYNVFPRFQREFTQGVKPDWTIARIEHSKLLE
jgi:hypothetical protein